MNFNIRAMGLRKNVRSNHINIGTNVVDYPNLSERTKTLFIQKLQSGGKNDRYRSSYHASLLLDYTDCFCLRVKFPINGFLLYRVSIGGVQTLMNGSVHHPTE